MQSPHDATTGENSAHTSPLPQFVQFAPGHKHVVGISEAWRGTEESTMPELLAKCHLGSLRGNMQRTRMDFEIRLHGLGFKWL